MSVYRRGWGGYGSGEPPSDGASRPVPSGLYRVNLGAGKPGEVIFKALTVRDEIEATAFAVERMPDEIDPIMAQMQVSTEIVRASIVRIDGQAVADDEGPYLEMDDWPMGKYGELLRAVNGVISPEGDEVAAALASAKKEKAGVGFDISPSLRVVIRQMSVGDQLKAYQAARKKYGIMESLAFARATTREMHQLSMCTPVKLAEMSLREARILEACYDEVNHVDMGKPPAVEPYDPAPAATPQSDSPSSGPSLTGISGAR